MHDHDHDRDHDHDHNHDHDHDHDHDHEHQVSDPELFLLSGRPSDTSPALKTRSEKLVRHLSQAQY